MPNNIFDNRLIEITKDILSTKYIDVEAELEENLKTEVLRLTTGLSNYINSTKLNLEYNDEYFTFFYIQDPDITPCTLKTLLSDHITASLDNPSITYTGCNIIFIVDKLHTKLSIEKIINTNGFKKNILTLLKTKASTTNIKSSDIDYKVVHISNIGNKDFSIKINSRIRSLEMPTNDTLSCNGYVFTANLFDIVNIYNSLGNELFDKNVRYGISDQLQVELKIKETLENNPQNFWYLNNGITMIIQDPNFVLNKSNSLTLSYEKQKKLYIINGAQTISAAAEFFYSNTDPTKLENAKKEAQVMLRIIQLVPDTTKNTKIDEISISLNRQKPIKLEDIAFTMPFIYSINKLYDLNATDTNYFHFIKRGEISLNETRSYDLVTFAKAVKAYLGQQPWSAMSSSIGLIQLQSDSSFKDTIIFKEDLTTEDGPNNSIFKKYYTPVNFSIRLSKIYSASIDTIKDSLDNANQAAILNYGKWHFVAYIIYVLNNYNTDDFSSFSADYSKLNSTFYPYIEKYIRLFDSIISSIGNYPQLTANLFKAENLYNDLKSNATTPEANQFNKEVVDYLK